MDTFYWRGFASAIGTNSAIASVMNVGRKNVQVRIENYDVLPVTPSPASSFDAISYYRTVKINARSDGGIPLTVINHNPSSSLPSQVKCEIFSHVTRTADSHIYDTQLTGQDIGGASAAITIYRGGWTGRTFSHKQRGAFVNVSGPLTQGLVMKEGEGIALVRISDTSNLPIRVFLNIGNAVFCDDLGNTFSVQFDLTSSEASSQAAFSIFNGVGSGRTITLLHVEAWPIAADNYNGTIACPPRLKAYVTMGDLGGQVVTPIPMVPGTTVPSSLVIKRSAIGSPRLTYVRDADPAVVRALNLDNDQFAGVGNVPPYGDPSRNSGLVLPFVAYSRPNAGLGDAGWQHHNNWSRHGIRNRSPNVQPVTLTPGQGFAICPDFLVYLGLASSIEFYSNRHAYWVELTISVDSGGIARAHA